MPYVQQRTWLPLAPRIPGLSLRESPYGFGMGDAPCPSPEQAAGIVDCNDPCQAPYGACAASQIGLPALPVSGAGSNPLNIGNPLLTTNSLAAWVQQNQNVILLAGAGLFGLALLKGLTR